MYVACPLLQRRAHHPRRGVLDRHKIEYIPQTPQPLLVDRREQAAKPVRGREDGDTIARLWFLRIQERTARWTRRPHHKRLASCCHTDAPAYPLARPAATDARLARHRSKFRWDSLISAAWRHGCTIAETTIRHAHRAILTHLISTDVLAGSFRG